MINESQSQPLPQKWKWVTLCEICDKISLNKIKIKQKDYLVEGLYPVIDQGQDLIGGYYNKKELVVPGDPPFIVFGDHTKVKKFINFKFIPGADGVKVLKAKKNIEPKFLYFSLFTINIEDKGYARHFQLVENEMFPLPPITIQQAIVSKIEELFSELDKGIESLKVAQQQLKVYRQSVLKWAFEGRLTNENVKEGELPKEWKWISIEEIADVGTGATPLKSRAAYYGGKIPWVTSGALNDEYVREASDFVTEIAIKETNLKVYPKHTLLLAMYGEGKTRGKCSELLIDACTNQAIAAISLNRENQILKPYLKYFLLKNYDDIRNKSSGGVQPNLNLGIIKKLKFPLSPKSEQGEVINLIESRLSVADKMEESIDQSLQQAEVMRQSVLKYAFTGELIK